jgi:sugar O-acyltransferase (sialic acid O-acetyltransferase NeuD family)
VPEPLVLVGCGGFGREAAEVARAINDRASRWELLGFLDDDPALWGATVSGIAVLGGLGELGGLPDARVVVCTGHPDDFGSRARIVKRLALPAQRFATLVHPAAVLPRSRRLGHGTVVLAGVVATADVAVGVHVALMPHVVLTHDDHVGAYATIGAGARLAGGVHVSEGAYLGAGCLIREGCRIGRGAIVGMGAVVLTDVPAGEAWVGVPARFLRTVVPRPRRGESASAWAS